MSYLRVYFFAQSFENDDELLHSSVLPNEIYVVFFFFHNSCRQSDYNNNIGSNDNNKKNHNLEREQQRVKKSSKWNDFKVSQQKYWKKFIELRER